MLYVEAKFASLIGSQLRNFKKKDDYLWNFSCPYCNDSSRNNLKSRGYIYRVKSDLFYKCHKCGKGTTLGNLIQHVNPPLYSEYVLERYKGGLNKYKPHKDISEVIPELIKPSLLTDDILSSLNDIYSLPETHPAVKYCIKRKIPKDKWHLLYFCKKFKTYVNSVKKSFTNMVDDNPRLIIPYFNNAGKCFAFQGRAFGNEQPKYYTIKIDDTEEKVYGLDRIDYSKRIYVVEGPIDSMFIPNSLAVSGSSFNTPIIQSLKSNATLVVDNEPRSKEIVKLIESYIDLEYNICIWPDTIKEKDINEMIMSGKTSGEIIDIINKNTYSGMEAKMHYIKWRKC